MGGRRGMKECCALLEGQKVKDFRQVNATRLVSDE